MHLRLAKRRCGLRSIAVVAVADTNKEVAGGDDGVARQCPHMAMVRSAVPYAAMRCSENEEPPTGVSLHIWRWREAPRHGLLL